MKSFLHSILLMVQCLIIAGISYIVPKKKGYAAFIYQRPGGANGRFEGNLKYLFKYIVSQKDSIINPVWLTNNPQTFSMLQKASYPVRDYKNLLFSILTPEYVFIDSTEPMLPWGKFQIFQLWHGTGFKNILLKSGKKKQFLIHYLRKRAFSKYRLIVASSQEDKERKIASFGNKNVVITGSPRNDLFYDSEFDVQSFKKKIGIDSCTIIYLYAPTYRNDTSETPFSEEFFTRAQKLMFESNSILLIKKHPNDKRCNMAGKYPHIRDITHDIEDVQELLAITDVLITDYSGISTDFAITNRPILFYFYDENEFIRKSRDFHYNLNSILPGPIIENEWDLLEKMFDLSWFENPSYFRKYDDFRKVFQVYNDGLSSERVYKWLKRKTR